MAKIKEYKPIQPEDRACFGTDELKIMMGYALIVDFTHYVELLNQK